MLAPNLKGFDAAVEAGRPRSPCSAPPPAFSQKNINCSVAESIKRFEPVICAALALDMKVRGYVSCVVGCPYEGAVAPEKAAEVAQRLFEMGCYEVSLGDTIGVGNPVSVQRMIEACARTVPMNKLAGHYHDTYGMAIANIYASMELGMRVFDSSVAGLGGCPYAAGAGERCHRRCRSPAERIGYRDGYRYGQAPGRRPVHPRHLGREPSSKAARALWARQRDGCA